jgi:hypothetical protein
MPVFAKHSSRLIVPGLAFGAIALIAAPAAQAGPVVNFAFNVQGGTGGPFSDSFSQNGNPTSDPQVFNFVSPVGGYNGPLNEWSSSWNFSADADPSGTGSQMGARIGAGFTVQNNRPDGPTAGDNHLFFSILVSIDVPATTSNFWFGNGGMTLFIDDSPNDFPGVLSAIGGPMWNFRINGSDATNLFQNGFQLGGSDGPSSPSTSATLSPAQTGPLVGMTPTSIGIRLDFDITPGERVTFNGVFGYTPAPGGLALLGLAGLVGASRRRRH